MHRTGAFLILVSLAVALVPAQQAALADTDPFIKALYRYMPVMRFDNGFQPLMAGERFFPVRVTAITDNPVIGCSVRTERS